MISCHLLPRAKLHFMRWPEACKFCESPRPRSFAALMDLYEHNYMRLRCLCPPLRDITGNHVSRVNNAHDLHLSIKDQTSHTTTLQMTYLMEDGARRPDVTIHVYHDAVQAEVISRRCRLGSEWLRSSDGQMGSALLCRWQLNRFLYKWLNYCQRQGHRFDLLPENADIMSAAEFPNCLENLR